MSKLKANVELCHRCHAYFMARVWYRDVSPSKDLSTVKLMARVPSAMTHMPSCSPA